jgi:hypothetical protein
MLVSREHREGVAVIGNVVQNAFKFTKLRSAVTPRP